MTPWWAVRAYPQYRAVAQAVACTVYRAATAIVSRSVGRERTNVDRKAARWASHMRPASVRSGAGGGKIAVTPPAPSPGTPGEGWGEGDPERRTGLGATKSPLTLTLSRRTGRGDRREKRRRIWPFSDDVALAVDADAEAVADRRRAVAADEYAQHGAAGADDGDPAKVAAVGRPQFQGDHLGLDAGGVRPGLASADEEPDAAGGGRVGRAGRAEVGRRQAGGGHVAVDDLAEPQDADDGRVPRMGERRRHRVERDRPAAVEDEHPVGQVQGVVPRVG